MKFSLKALFVVAAIGAFSTTSCSQKEQDNAEANTEQAAENTGNAMENAADNAGNAVGDAANEVKADMAPEKGDTAVVRNVPAEKMVEETPASH